MAGLVLTSGSVPFTATGNTFAFAGGNVQPTLLLGGSGVGTIEVGINRPGGGSGSCQPLIPLGQTTASITANGAYTYPFVGGDWEFYIMCTAYTSGTFAALLQAGGRA